MEIDVVRALSSRGIRPSAQRAAVARYVLGTEEHPSADEVFARVRATFPFVSRATVYNTLNLFVEKGLLRARAPGDGRTVFDRNVEPHHHFVDERTGRVVDVPWDALTVAGIASLSEFDVRAYEVVLVGRAVRKPPKGTRTCSTPQARSPRSPARKSRKR